MKYITTNGMFICLTFAAICLCPSAANAQVKKQTEDRFKLALIRVGNTFQGIRYDFRSGKSWLINTGRWAPIPEKGPVPAGNYEVRLVATETDFSAFRFDRKSGATWQLQNRTWVRVQEPNETGVANAKPQAAE